ncbi:MAG: helicase-exonuclease AddAB subunit AddA [Clostridia bacterium]|nr:helicase-exonuclease AddAB subunit AddA [Clostridia bacterium]
MEWTKEQEQAITLRGKNILVAAAAGSGKTAILVERIIRLVIEYQVPIDKMLVVTFTKAAASEMKEKIIKRLTEIIEDGQGSDFLKEQLDIIHRANISTFHSFGEQVIKENFHAIGLEPSLSVADEVESTLLKEQAVEALLEERYEESSEEFLDFLDAYGQEKSDSKIRELIVVAHKKLMSLPYPWKVLEEELEELKNPKRDGKIFRSIERYVKSQMKHAASIARDTARFLLDEGFPILADRILQKDVMYLEAGNVLAVDYARLTLPKEYKESYEDVRKIVEAKRKQYKDIVTELRDKFYYEGMEQELKELYPRFKVFVKLIQDFDEKYTQEKLRKRQIDFSDIEHYCLKILEDEEIAKIYRDRFEYIFVDEYQDSNLVQEEIIGKICRENNRFLVGDVKQSIYKFRLAEPEIFRTRYEEFKGDPNSVKIDLNKNFRSKGNVIDSVNLFFESIMDGYDKDAMLYKGDPYEGPLDVRTSLHILEESKDIDDMSDAIKELERNEKEAILVAKLIEETLGQEIYDSKEKKVRKIEKRDIAILLRGVKNTGKKYYDVLMENNIPSYITADEGYFGTIEVDAMVNLLTVIDNKQQDIPLVAVLSQEAFGYSVEELVDIRNKGERGPFYKAFLDHAKTDERARQVLGTLDRWKKLSSLMPLDKFIWQVMLESGIYLAMGALPGGVQRQANLRSLVDKALGYEGNLYSFIQYIDMLKQQKIAVGQVKLVGEKDDLVRIMTIHKSKGLEFPVVIVAGLGKEKRPQREPVVFHKDVGLGMELVNLDERWKKDTPLDLIIKAKNKQDALEEEIRILYVALTRAKDRLLLVGNIDDLAGYKEKVMYGFRGYSRYLDMIGVDAYRSPIIDVYYHSDASLGKHMLAKKRKLDKVLSVFDETEPKVDEALAMEVERRVNFEYPYRKAMNLKSKYSVSELNQRERSTKIKKLTLEEGKLSQAAKGTIYHTVMEHIPFEEDFDLEKVIQSLVDREILLEEEAKVVDKDKVMAFFNSDIGKRAVKAAREGKLYKEKPFTVKTNMDGEEVLVQGIIDAFFIEEDEIVLLDYKTNFVESEEDVERIKETYKVQMDMYRAALAEGMDMPVKEAYLYLAGLRRFVSMM